MSGPYRSVFRDGLFAGRVVMVTGGGSGIGRCTAHELSNLGASVALVGRKIEKLQAVQAEIEAAGGKALAVQMDATDADSMIAAVAAAEAAFGTVDILVNNAGMPDAQRAHKMSLELIDNVIGVNLRGPWILSCEVARRLIAAGKPGRMVNISSVAHYKYDGNGAALYAVTKTAIARMTDALSMEWAPYNINVNAIAPGMFVSEMTDGMFERMGGNPAPHVARKRIPVPEQMDSTLLYLVAPASECVTGAIIKIDDGQGSAVRLRS